MLLNQIENPNNEIKDFTYYSIHLWPDINKPGITYKIAYKREKNAGKMAVKLIDSGLYESLVLRKNEVIKRDINNDYSISSPVYAWNNKEGVYKNDLRCNEIFKIRIYK